MMALPSPTAPEKKSSNEGEELMSELRKYLMLMAILAATVTYVAGLNPPGGVWLESEDGHLTGNQILVVTHHARYNAFYYSNVIAFMASVVVILLLLLERSVVDQVWWLFSLKMVLVLDLLALMVAYAAGASRGMFATVYASVQVSAVSIYAGTHIIRYFQAGGPHRHRHSAAGKGGKKEQDARMKGLSKILLVFAFFAATVTYTAGLNPPGGFWPDSNDGHRAGDPVLQDFHHWLRFMAFFVCNSAAFAASLVAVMLLTTMNSDPDPEEDKGHHLPVAYWFVLVALLGLFFAYVFGSSTKTGSTIYVLFLQLPLLVGCILLQKPTHGQEEGRPGNTAGEEERVGAAAENQQPNTATSNKEEGQSNEKKDMYTTRKYMVMVAILVAGVTYQAGLTPPGGVWPDSTDGHGAGDPVLRDTNKRRYRFFFDSNSVSFLMSLLVILLLLLDEPLFARKEKELPATQASCGKKKKKDGLLGMGCKELLRVAQPSLLMALLGLLFAYAAGCSREWETSVYVFALAGGVLLYIVIHVLLSYCDKSSSFTLLINQLNIAIKPSSVDQEASATLSELWVCLLEVPPEAKQRVGRDLQVELDEIVGSSSTQYLAPSSYPPHENDGP
uniref:Uncharacterized protein n=1 Tax=Avena sativa TaxID=4498 RepID=A0ACD5TJA0_AVESA